MIYRKNIFDSYIFLILLFLFFFDFILIYIEMIFKIPIPPIGIIAFVLIIPLILNIIFNLLFKKKIEVGIWLYFFIFIFLLFLMFIRISFSFRKEFFDYFILFKYLIFFVFGYYVYILFEDNSKYRNIFFILIMIMFFVLFYNYYIREVLSLFLNHLRLAESFVFISLCALVKNKNKAFYQIILLISLLFLFILQSRASFFVYLIVFFIFIITRFGFRYCIKIFNNYFLAFVSIIVIGITFFTQKFFYLINVIMDSEILHLVLWSDKDGSLSARSLYYLRGMERIQEHTFWGDFKGQLSFGEFGTYIHNIFSYWSQFGFLTFFLFSALILVGLIFFIKNIRKNRNNEAFLFAFIYFLYVVLMVLLAKSYIYMNIYIGFGLLFHALQKHSEMKLSLNMEKELC